MMETAINLNEKNKTISQWLFNPFYYLAGMKAMMIGIAVILISGCLAFLGNSRFDGLLDFHTSLLRSPFWHVMTDGLMAWLLISVLLFIAGKFISKSSIRMIDVLGTQALARTPYLILGLVSVIPGIAPKALRFGMSLAANQAVFNFSSDILAFAFIILVSICMAIWMIFLMYRAFTVSCNVAGSMAVIAFIVCILIGEVLSKVIIFQISRL